MNKYLFSIQELFRTYSIIQNQADPFCFSSTGPPVEGSDGVRTRYQKSAAQPTNYNKTTNSCPNDLVSSTSWKLLGSESVISSEGPEFS